MGIFENNGKVPPQNIEIEKAILGALLIEKGAYLRISKDLSEELFYSDQNQCVVRALIAMNEVNTPTDILTVCHWLKKHELLEYAGGFHYISTLTTNIGSSAHLESHILIIKQFAIQRELIKIAGNLLKKAYEDDVDAFDLLNDTEVQLANINETAIVKDFETTEDLIRQSIERNNFIIENEGKVVGVATLYPEIDMVTCGWKPGNMIIIAARPGEGKTAFAINTAVNIADSGVPVGFFSLEMENIELFQRVISNYTGIELDIVLNKGLKGDLLREFNKCVDKIIKMPMYFDQTGGISLFQLKQKARKLVKEKKVKIIFIDYLQLITTNVKGNREQEISLISRSIKALAKELKIPIVPLAQLSRESSKRADKKPTLSDLRESGALEQDADQVIFPWRPYLHGIEEMNGVNMFDKALFLIAKNRNGATDMNGIPLRWMGNIVKFTSLIESNRSVMNYHEEDKPF